MVDFPFAVWGTQGGGLVGWVGGYYVFVTDSGCPGFKVGDVMPMEWGVEPANGAARDEEFVRDCEY